MTEKSILVKINVETKNIIQFVEPMEFHITVHVMLDVEVLPLLPMDLVDLLKTLLIVFVLMSQCQFVELTEEIT